MVAGISSAVVFVIWSATQWTLNIFIEIIVVIVDLFPMDTSAVHETPPGIVKMLNLK